MGMDILNELPDFPQEEINPAGEEDFVGEDGLLVCGICRKRKQYRIELGDFTKIVPCMCKCRQKEAEDRRKQEEFREQMHRIKRLRDASMMSGKFQEATFDKYILRDNNKEAYRVAKKYVETFREMYAKNQGLLFYGPVGTGKSYTAACIANELLANERSVIMTSFVKILQDIWNSEKEADYIAILNSASLLIIDDLGTERGTDYSLEKVYNVIDSRVRSNKPMILTTNLELRGMMESTDIRYRRIYDRIFENCYPVEMPGKSFRVMKAAERFEDMKKILEG